MCLKTAYESDFYHVQVDLTRNLLSAKWLRPISTAEIIVGGTNLYEVLQATHLSSAGIYKDK